MSKLVLIGSRQKIMIICVPENLSYILNGLSCYSIGEGMIEIIPYGHIDRLNHLDASDQDFIIVDMDVFHKMRARFVDGDIIPRVDVLCYLEDVQHELVYRIDFDVIKPCFISNAGIELF